MLGWHLSIGNIAIPESTHQHRIRENLAGAEITLGRDELDAIKALESGVLIVAEPAEAAFTQI